MRYQLIPKFCAESGYTEKAVRRKIEEGVWLENHQYRRAPDGQVVIDVEAALAADTPIWSPGPSCGVYILRHEGAVVYVGRSTTLETRIQTHRASGRRFDEHDIIPCDEPTSIWLEKELIRTLRPTQNLVRYERHARAIRRQQEGRH